MTLIINNHETLTKFCLVRGLFGIIAILKNKEEIMKYAILILIFVSGLFANIVKAPIVSVNETENIATVKVEKIDVGMSGFVMHTLADNHTVILKNIVVQSYDENSKIATLELSDYNALVQNALPNGKWKVQVGDTALLAFGYSRALLVAPSEEIYHRITTSTKSVQWIHPDLFATILSLSGHPTPLRSDFTNLSIATAAGIVFIYLDKKVFTLDAQSFKILSISDAPLVQDKAQLPFYTRVEKITANWWGEGSGELKDYEPHYYELMIDANKENKQLYEIVKNGDKKLQNLLENFELKD